MRNPVMVLGWALTAAVLMTGCAVDSSGAEGTTSAPTSQVSVVEGAAELDLRTASFSLPLDAYGMDVRGRQIVLAAEQIVFAQCITGSTDVDKAVVAAARRTLSVKPPVAHWLFGYWDADYVAAHGVEASQTSVPLGEGLEKVDPIAAKACVASEEYRDFEIIAPDYQSQGVETQTLSAASLQSWDKTVADPRFQQLAQQRDECLAGRGYAIDHDSKLTGVTIDDAWSKEDKLKAALAEARCADQVDLSQKAADIQAAYQRQAIEDNQAEYVQLRKLADDRVAQSTALLQQVGVM